MKKTHSSHDTLKDIVVSSNLTFSATSTSTSAASFSVVASQSFLMLKPLNSALVLPTKLKEVSEIVAHLVECKLVAEELMGAALKARVAELKNLEAALAVSGTRVTPARLVKVVDFSNTNFEQLV